MLLQPKGMSGPAKGSGRLISYRADERINVESNQMTSKHARYRRQNVPIIGSDETETPHLECQDDLPKLVGGDVGGVLVELNDPESGGHTDHRTRSRMTMCKAPVRLCRDLEPPGDGDGA